MARARRSGWASAELVAGVLGLAVPMIASCRGDTNVTSIGSGGGDAAAGSAGAVGAGGNAAGGTGGQGASASGGSAGTGAASGGSAGTGAAAAGGSASGGAGNGGAGAGGIGGAGGASAAGGGGGQAGAMDAGDDAPSFVNDATLPPLDGTEYSQYFSFASANARAVCSVIRMHEVDFAVAGSATPPNVVPPPTWGHHGGPLSASVPAPGTLRLRRWRLDAAPTGTLAFMEVNVTPPGLPATQIFWGAPADAPWGHTVVSYTASGAAGEVMLVGAGGGVVTRGAVNGFFSALGVVSGITRRVVFSALSPVASAASDGGSDNGLYGVDVCEGDSFFGASCLPSSQLTSWTGYSGPLAVDANGNVFAEKYSTSQEFGGFDQRVVAYQKANLFSVTGFGQLGDGITVYDAADGMHSMAAISPGGGKDGLLVTTEQTFSSTKAPIATRYRLPSTFEPLGALMMPASPGAAIAVFGESFSSLGGRHFWAAMNRNAGTDGVFFKIRCDGP